MAVRALGHVGYNTAGALFKFPGFKFSARRGRRPLHCPRGRGP